MFEDRNPSGRFGTAEEVALLAVYLASDEVSAVWFLPFLGSSMPQFFLKLIFSNLRFV